MCDKGYTACGILGRSKIVKDSYECVDTWSDLESCEFDLPFVACIEALYVVCGCGG